MLLQGNSPVILTGSGACAYSFCLYFSYSVSLAKTIIYCGLRGLFICVGASLGNLCGFTIFLSFFFFFFWPEGCLRAAFCCGCWLPVSSVWAGHYLFDKACAAACPVCSSREMGAVGGHSVAGPSEAATPGVTRMAGAAWHGTLSSAGLCPPLEYKMAAAVCS